MQRLSLASIVGGARLDGAAAATQAAAKQADEEAAAAAQTVDFEEDEEEGRKKKKDKKKKTGGFQSFGLIPPVFKGVMKMGFKVPTPIQRQAIPALLSGADVVAMARTGSGKTAAFLIPMLDKLNSRDAKIGVRGLVLSPTRELAMQTAHVSNQLGKFTGLRSCLLVGGSSMSSQFESLEENPDIIIATPGRLMHHLIEVKFSLKQVQFCVFDEADRLFEMGFAAQLHEILKQLGEHRQTSLFSATLPKQLVEFTRAGLKDPRVIRLDADSKISPLLQMQFFTVRKDQKCAALLFLLKEVLKRDEQTIVFAATRHHVEYLHMLLGAADIPSAPVYGQLDPAARKINLAKFRTKKCSILLVTDVAARGIDIPLLDNVINYDFPAKPKLFVHRAGRVARAGRSGCAYSLVAPDELPYMLDLHLFFGRRLRNEVGNSGSSNDHNDNGDHDEKQTADASPSQYDPKQVYYGCLPREQLELETDRVKPLVASAGLDRQFAVAERAYKQYNKTREGASTASAQRAKLMEAPKLHPMFASVQSAESRGIDDFLSGIRKYKGGSTIFEVKQLGMKSGSEVMKMKRSTHDILIEAKKVVEQREQEMARKAEEMKINYGKAGFKKVDKSDLPEYDHANEMDEDNDDDDEEDEFADSDGNADDDEYGDASDDDDAEDDESADEDASMDEDEDEDEDVGASAVTGVKRKSVDVAASKARPSKKERELAKKKRKLANGTSRNVDADDDDDEDHHSPSHHGAIHPMATSSRYRDPNFFISDTPSDAAAERGLSLDDNNRRGVGGVRLEDMVLDVVGDDEAGFAKARAIHVWDQRKKKYVRQVVGGDPFKKQRNEAGQLIRPKDQPELYAAWKRAHKKGVEHGGRPTAMGDGDEDGDDNAHHAASSRSGGRGGKGSNKGGRASKGTDKGKGKGKGKGKSNIPSSELKTPEQIRKGRIQKEKNKMKNQKGGFRAANAKASGRGGKRGGGRGRKSG